MTISWDRQADETAEWYDRFTLYLYMGPDRTIAAAHRFAGRLAKGAAHGQLSSWRRAARHHRWKVRAATFDAEFYRKAASTTASREKSSEWSSDGDQRAWTNEELLRMVAELLHQVYGVLRHADLLSLTKEEARQLLPTFRIFFRDLLRFYQHEAASSTAVHEDAGVELSADDLMKFMTERGGWQMFLADLKRVSEASAGESSWQPLRDVLAQLYPDEVSARRIAAQAQLDSTRIHFSPHAVNSWHAILTEAAHVGRMESVINVAQREYSTNRQLAKAIRDYRRSRR